MMMEEIQPKDEGKTDEGHNTDEAVARWNDSVSLGVLSTTSALASAWGGFRFSLWMEAEERDDFFSRTSSVGGAWPCSRLSVLLVVKTETGMDPMGRRDSDIDRKIETYKVARKKVQLSCVRVIRSNVIPGSQALSNALGITSPSSSLLQ